MRLREVTPVASSVIKAQPVGAGINLRQYACSNSASLTIPIANSERGMIVGAGGGTNSKVMYIYNASSSGGVTYEAVRNSADIALDRSATNALTVTNSTGSYLEFLVISY